VIDARPDPILLLTDAHGVYIPRDFTISVGRENVLNVTDEDWAVLKAGPDSEGYWDVWLEVCERAVVVDDKGMKYHVYQEGDCWLIPVGMTWDDDTDGWKWP